MAMVGFGKSTSSSTMRFSDSTRARPSAAVWRFARMVLTSPPEQKWPPAPVRITTRTASSASISSSTAASSRRMTKSSAWRAPGRFSVIAHELRRALPDAPLGVNMLKNDARSALAVATAIGARFIRVNVLAGAVVADQGIVQTDAHDLLRDRRLLGVDVAIFADVQGKHAVPLAPVELEQQARDLAGRALADGLVVSGRATGDATPIEDVKRVRSAVPDVPILVGSGVTPETAPELLSLADALIVGTSLKRDGDVSAPVDPARVRA